MENFILWFSCCPSPGSDIADSLEDMTMAGYGRAHHADEDGKSEVDDLRPSEW